MPPLRFKAPTEEQHVLTSAEEILDYVESKCFDYGQMGPPGGLEGIIAVAKAVKESTRLDELIEALEKDLENESAER